MYYSSYMQFFVYVLFILVCAGNLSLYILSSTFCWKSEFEGVKLLKSIFQFFFYV